MSKEQVDSYRIDGGLYCIADELLDAGVVKPDKVVACGSSDAMSVYMTEYDDGSERMSTFCFSCNQAFQHSIFAKSSHAPDFGLEDTGVIKEKKKFEKKNKQKPLTKEDVQEIIGLGYRGNGYRNLSDKYLQFFGHAVKKGKDGKVVAVYYPESREGKLKGYKSRHAPKNFGYDNRGLTGLKSELSGQIKFKDWKFRDILIVGGEEDKVAAYQMFTEYLERRYSNTGDEYLPMPVVSPTTGEGSAIKQIREQFDFIDSAENIYIGMDNDEVGEAAAEAIAEMFPKDKVKMVKWSLKDPNNYIHNKDKKDYSAQFIRDFYAAEGYTHDGIRSSKDIYGDVAEELLKPRISLPFYMTKLAKMMGGNSGDIGLLQGRIVNIIGDTSVGKSTHVNAMVYHWIFNSPQKPCIASLEATAGQYAIDMISLHLGENIRKDRTGKEVVEYLESEEVQAKTRDLWENEWGEERFKIIDERDGTIKTLEKQMERAFHKDGCGMFVIDVLTDILRNMTNEQQAEHMTWQKNMVKKGATIINILHTKKPTRRADGTLNRISEYDALGSSTFVQSAAVNILIDRDKMAEDDIEKNTTRVRMPKCREGSTGDAGCWFFDIDTRMVHDRDHFFEQNPHLLPDGYDLSVSPYDAPVEQKGFTKQASGKSKKDLPVDDFDLLPEDDIPV